MFGKPPESRSISPPSLQ